MKKNDEKENISSSDNSKEKDFSDLDFDIDEYLEHLSEKYNTTEIKKEDKPTDKAREHKEEKSEKTEQNNKEEKEETKKEDKKDEYADIMLPLSRSAKNKSRVQKKSSDENFFKKYHIFKIIGCLILAIALCITAYIGYTLHHVNNLIETSYTGKKETKDDSDKLTMTKKPISILLMGIDNTAERNLETTRTDSLIVCTFNPKNGETSMVSIPRDTYVEMQDKKNDYNTTGKINSAYEIEGADSTINAVENLLDIPIDYYVQVDFNTLEDVVNAFDGVYLDVPFTLTEQDAHGKKRIHFTEGKHQKLNGEEVLAFARTRHIDNDIERGVRQQQVISAILDQALKVGSMTKYAKVLQSLNGHIKTDMPKSVILGLAKSSTEHKVNIKHYQFKWQSFNYNGESFVALNKESLSLIRHRFRVQLGLDKKDDRDKENYKEPDTYELDDSTYPSYGVTWDE